MPRTMRSRGIRKRLNIDDGLIADWLLRDGVVRIADERGYILLTTGQWQTLARWLEEIDEEWQIAREQDREARGHA